MERKFQVDRNKSFKGTNIFSKNKSFNKSIDNLSKSDRLTQGVGIWASFYRSNPQRFAQEYLGLHLKLFQQILLYVMFHNNYVQYFAARSQGKTWLTAVFCVCYAILYPSVKIVVASGSKGQAMKIVTEKIPEIMGKSPNLTREISDISTSMNSDKANVIFHNGSWIKVVASNEKARSARSNINIYDEHRIINLDIINKVLRRFLGTPRQPAYLAKKEYKHLQERNKEIYLSSAWFKHHWSWDKFKSFKNKFIKGEKYFLCGLPYQLSIAEGLLSEEQVKDEMSEDDFDEISWSIEMECLFFGESEKAYFKLAEIEKSRKLKKPFYPIKNIDYISHKRKKDKLRDGEIRIIGVDLALMGGSKNDASVFTCMRLLPSGKKYIKQVVYIESLNGQHTSIQAVRLKQLFEDFQASYVAMDCHGNGMSLYDDCSKVLYDEERDVEYESWCSYNDEVMRERALGRNPLPVIFSIKAGQSLNHEIATSLRSDLQKDNIQFLVNEIEAKDHISEIYKTNNPNDLADYVRPYMQTSALVNELVNLEYEIIGGFVKLKEPKGKRKDRASSLMYANYLAKLLAKELYEDDDDDPNDEFVYY